MKEERNHKQYSGIYTLYFWIHDNNFLLKQQEKKKNVKKRLSNTYWKKEEKFESDTFTYSQVLSGGRIP